MTATAKLALPEVTICSADSAFVELTARALKLSMDRVDFGDAILFTDKPRGDTAFRTVRIEPLNSLADYSHFCLRKLVEHIETPYALIVQWDGYVLNPAVWARAFEKYDYIGAAWHGLFPPELMVGNGGFSLRSRKLLRAVAQLPLGADTVEDRVICHQHRETLERRFGVRFAPVKIADRFAYQYRVPETMPFGFHGCYHMWRHTTDDELAGVVAAMDVSKSNANHTIRMLVEAARNDHPQAARVLYAKVKQRYTPATFSKFLGTVVAPAEVDVARAELDRLGR